MIRNQLIWVLSTFFVTISLSAQIEEVVSPLLGRSMSNFKVTTGNCDTTGLPFQDDFSGVEGWPDQRRWCDNKVWINDTYGLDVPTLGVATFDGLDENGQAYDINDNDSDTIADVLTSKYIGFGPNPQNVYLSFLYQVGGRGERPTSGDFLTVQFWSPVDSSWLPVWIKNADSIIDFRHAIIPVDSSIWLQDGFRFRFAAFGARSGSFDIWNIDYVRLGAGRSPVDTAFTDAGFTRQHPSLLTNYWQVPWFHLQNVPNPFVDEFDLHYRKNGDTLSVSINLRGYTMEYDGNPLQSKNGIPWNNFSYNKEHPVPVPIDPVNLLPPPSGPFELSVTSIMTGANDGFRSNDTVTGRHNFDNYYAYDDGSAERVYGLTNVGGAITAINLTPLKPDTLKGFYVYFGQAKVDAKLNDFQIGVWENDNGIPGDLIYLSDTSYTPDYFNHNQYAAYPVDSAVFINNSVFVGLKQRTVDPLNIGLDVNRPDGDTLTTIYYNDGINWYQSLFPGNLMIRPYFSYQPQDLTTPELEEEASITVFPNPVEDVLNISLKEDVDCNWSVMDINGRILMEGSIDYLDSQISCRQLNSGLFILTLTSDEGQFLGHFKFIKK